VRPHPDFKDKNINDLVLFTIYPILRSFKHNASRKLSLQREKKLISVDSTDNMEEFVILDKFDVGAENVRLSHRSEKVFSRGSKKMVFPRFERHERQQRWRYSIRVLVSFDGAFEISEKMELLFDTMDEDKTEMG